MIAHSATMTESRVGGGAELVVVTLDSRLRGKDEKSAGKTPGRGKYGGSDEEKGVLVAEIHYFTSSLLGNFGTSRSLVQLTEGTPQVKSSERGQTENPTCRAFPERPLPLGILESRAGTLLAVLLALFHSRVARQVPCTAQY